MAGESCITSPTILVYPQGIPRAHILSFNSEGEYFTQANNTAIKEAAMVCGRLPLLSRCFGLQPHRWHAGWGNEIYCLTHLEGKECRKTEQTSWCSMWTTSVSAVWKWREPCVTNYCHFSFPKCFVSSKQGFYCRGKSTNSDTSPFGFSNYM